MQITVTAQQLQEFIERNLTALGLPDADVTIVAELMAEADLSGSDGHGVFRLPQYVKRVQSGGINVTPDIHLEKDTGAMAVVNGDDGMGHLVMNYATGVAMDKASEQGIGWVGVQHSVKNISEAVFCITCAIDTTNIYLGITRFSCVDHDDSGHQLDEIFSALHTGIFQSCLSQGSNCARNIPELFLSSTSRDNDLLHEQRIAIIAALAIRWLRHDGHYADN